jgi:IS30 family transposase
MGKNYAQLDLEERMRIELLRDAGSSIREIARKLGRQASTVSRELRRNAKPTKQWNANYAGERAHQLALRRRRWDCRFKLARQPELQTIVRDRLAMGWSPQMIAGRLALEQAPMRISHESIYRFIYHRTAQKDWWHRLLPRAKHRRGRIRRGGISSVQHIKQRISIHERPHTVNSRKQPGHWEADLMLFARYSQAVLVLHERHSRFTAIMRQPSKAARPVIDRINSFMAVLPRQLRQSITFDNGTEFAFHHELKPMLVAGTYFCAPHAPWQKGGVENAISRLRRSLPTKSDLAAIPHEHLKAIETRYNNAPRKCLNFRTPNEVFNELVNRVALQT